ncbi:MAG: glycosyltransferase family 2 protein [Campylobacterota bacterium]|nr:glycosyltransferase family 2 protein [Campylobacterota bacterium]
MIKDQPLVTIIMATYNGESFLEEQLNSIVEQKYNNIELLIADDNSTDKTYQILSHYAQIFSWIHIYRNNKHLGLVKNFEKLLKQAQGKYIAFCDQDDVWEEDKLWIAIDSLAGESSQQPLMFHSDLTAVDKNLQVIAASYFSMRAYTFREKKELSVMLGRSGIMGNTMVINQKLKSLVLPFPPDLKAHDYWIALINELYGKRLISHEPLVKYRLHHTNSSNRISTITSQIFSIDHLSREMIRLPFFGIKREKALRFLLKQYRVKDEDREIILKFIDYLEFKKSRIYLIYLIFKYNFLRDNFGYRIKIALKMIWKKG